MENGIRSYMLFFSFETYILGFQMNCSRFPESLLIICICCRYSYIIFTHPFHFVLKISQIALYTRSISLSRVYLLFTVQIPFLLSNWVRPRSSDECYYLLVAFMWKLHWPLCVCVHEKEWEGDWLYVDTRRLRLTRLWFMIVIRII